MSVERFRNMRGAADAVCREAREIFATFVAVGSEMQVNVSEATRCRLRDSLDYAERGMFDEAQTQVTQIMRLGFLPQFIMSEHYDRMQAKIRARESAVATVPQIVASPSASMRNVATTASRGRARRQSIGLERLFQPGDVELPASSAAVPRRVGHFWRSERKKAPRVGRNQARRSAAVKGIKGHKTVELRMVGKKTVG